MKWQLYAFDIMALDGEDLRRLPAVDAQDCRAMLRQCRPKRVDQLGQALDLGQYLFQGVVRWRGATWHRLVTGCQMAFEPIDDLLHRISVAFETISKMPPICGSSAKRIRRSIAKSSPVGRMRPWLIHATIRIAASVCGSAVCPTECTA